MKYYHIFIIILILLFYSRFNLFIDLGGFNFPLLKILMELIIIIFVLVLVKYKEELKEITKFDKFQRKIEDYFHTEEK